MNGQPPTPTASSSPYVLASHEGESLLIGSRRAPLVIKVAPETGSHHMAIIMERIAPGTGIPVHLHQAEDEIIFINSGEGLQRLGETEFIVRTGSLVYIPRGTWHGLHNSDAEADLVMVAVFSPTGMEGYFRAIGTKPEEEYEPLTPEQEEKIERLYGIQYKSG